MEQCPARIPFDLQGCRWDSAVPDPMENRRSPHCTVDSFNCALISSTPPEPAPTHRISDLPPTRGEPGAFGVDLPLPPPPPAAADDLPALVLAMAEASAPTPPFLASAEPALPPSPPRFFSAASPGIGRRNPRGAFGPLMHSIKLKCACTVASIRCENCCTFMIDGGKKKRGNLGKSVKEFQIIA